MDSAIRLSNNRGQTFNIRLTNNSFNLTLMMTSAQVVETSVTFTDNSPFQDYPHQDDHTTRSSIYCVDIRSVWRPIRKICVFMFMWIVDRSTLPKIMPICSKMLGTDSAIAEDLYPSPPLPLHTLHPQPPPPQSYPFFALAVSAEAGSQSTAHLSIRCIIPGKTKLSQISHC